MASQNEKHGELLSAICNTHLQGLDRHVELPKIILLGDSDVKKEVWKAIGMRSVDNINPFPFCVEFVCQPSSQQDQHIIDASILPFRPQDEHLRYRPMHPTLALPENPALGLIFKAAEEALDHLEHCFYPILRIEIRAVGLPHCIIVDMPEDAFLPIARGLPFDYTFGHKAWPDYLRLLQNPRNMLLCDINRAKTFDNLIPDIAHWLDPSGSRTFRLSSSLSDVMNSWWNLSSKATTEFKIHCPQSRPPQVGYNPSLLKDLLGQVFEKQVLHHLQGILTEIGSKHHTNSLIRCNLLETREPFYSVLLTVASRRFKRLMVAATKGTFNDVCFDGSIFDVMQGSKRLSQNGDNLQLRRAVYGCIIGLEHRMARSSNPQGPGEFPRRTPVQLAARLVRLHRGQAPPGTITPAAVVELCVYQCRPWEAIIAKSRRAVLAAVEYIVVCAVEEVVHPLDLPAEAILAIIRPVLRKVKASFTVAVRERTTVNIVTHPIDFNNTTLLNHVQNARQHRKELDVLTAMRQAGPLDCCPLDCGLDPHPQMTVDPHELRQFLTSNNRGQHPISPNFHPEMDNQAGELAIDYADAHCQMICRDIVSKFINTVELDLLQKLPTIFSPDWVSTMTEYDVSKTVNEAASVIIETMDILESLQRQLSISSTDATPEAIPDVESVTVDGEHTPTASAFGSDGGQARSQSALSWIHRDL